MTSGIYIMTNKQTGKRYVGYSEDIEMRLTENMRQLQAKTFGEAYRDLISDYQKYGETAFICGILEVTDSNPRLMQQKSAAWKKKINPEYNDHDNKDNLAVIEQ